MATLDQFVPNVLTQDTRKRTQVHTELVNFLSDPNASVQCEEMDTLIDGLVQWLQGSNYKIVLNGLEILVLLLDHMGDHFKHHVSTVLPPLLERFGDGKDAVRDQALSLSVKLMEIVAPQYVFDRLTSAFSHKLWRVREGVMMVLQSTIDEYGAKSLTLSKIVPLIVKCLDDQNAQVRETSVNTLVLIYRHVGEKVRMDIAKKNIATSKLNVLLSRFDEVRSTGQMLVTETSTKVDKDGDSRSAPSAKRVTSAPVKKSFSTTRTNVSSAGAGAVDEEFFMNQFEDVSKVMFFSSRELTDHMNKVNNMLSDPNNDWEKRVDSLKMSRSLLIAGAANHDEYFQLLRIQESCFVTSVKDLRSQIVREACITIAYMSQQLGSKFDHFAESVLPELIKLLPNTVKVMATSAAVCIRFLIQNTSSQRLIPIVTSSLSAKSSIIRRFACEYLEQMLHTWPTHTLERHIAILQEAIKKGIGDADADARAFSRKAFWGFASHFKDQADSLLNSLDSSKQRMLQGELSNSSSSNSLNSAGSLRTGKGRARSASIDRAEPMTIPARPKPLAQRRASKPEEPVSKSVISKNIPRSNSDLDLTSPKKTLSARLAEATYNSLPRGKGNGVASTQSVASHIVSPERSRPRSRIGVSQSQPSSRSGSPSSRLNYVTYNNRSEPSPSQKKRSVIPRSQGASRESSPTRISARERRASGGGRIGYAQRVSQNKNTSSSNTGGTTSMAQRVLGTGKDTEQALAQALLNTASRKRFDTYDSDDNASETSSICSERSYSSYGRTSENVDHADRRKSHHSSQKDVAEIVTNLSSGSWADRKEGLQALQNLLHSGRTLNRMEIKKLTEIFTRMFHDPHGKVFGVFLETLIEFMYIYRIDIQDWLYVLLTRLLNKLGADMLGSVQSKVARALDAVRENFQYDHQFSILAKYIIDQTQTHNLKVKTGLLNYMYSLIMLMDPSDLVSTSDTKLAVSRIITWTTEPKSVDVRKAASAVIIALFDLNSPEFSTMLSSLPKTFQEGATKIIHNHLRKASVSDTDVLSPRNVTSPPGHTPSRYKPATPRSNLCRDEFETENMNPEEIYNSIRQTSADIQNLSYNSKLDTHYDDIKKERDTTSQDSGIQSSLPDLRDSDHSQSRAEQHKQQYNPSHYQDSDTNGYNRAALAEAIFDNDIEVFQEVPARPAQRKKSDVPGDMIGEILSELSNHNERHEQRKNAMTQLIKMVRDGVMTKLELWDEHFKSVLLILLETLGDNDGKVRAFSLRTLREILRNQPERFRDYAELTILRVLEAHQDPAKDVVRSAEDCASTLANAIPSEQCCRILQPIIKSADYPVSLAALKLENKIVDQIPRDLLLRILSDMTPELIKACDHDESAMRKAAVFCLVSVYMIVGEDLRPYLNELNGSKLKLLNLYIKREQAKRLEQATSSKLVSPSSSEGML